MGSRREMEMMRSLGKAVKASRKHNLGIPWALSLEQHILIIDSFLFAFPALLSTIKAICVYSGRNIKCGITWIWILSWLLLCDFRKMTLLL